MKKISKKCGTICGTEKRKKAETIDIAIVEKIMKWFRENQNNIKD